MVYKDFLVAKSAERSINTGRDNARPSITRAWACPRPAAKQNKNLTGPLVIGSDFQKTLAHLPFWATTISPEQGINLSFAQRSQLKTPINERLNFILLPLWRSLYGHDSEMDATIGSRADRHLAVTNTTRIGLRSGHAILVTGCFDWPFRFRSDARLVRLMLALSATLMLASYWTRVYRGSLVAFELPFFAK